MDFFAGVRVEKEGKAKQFVDFLSNIVFHPTDFPSNNKFVTAIAITTSLPCQWFFSRVWPLKTNKLPMKRWILSLWTRSLQCSRTGATWHSSLAPRDTSPTTWTATSSSSYFTSSNSKTMVKDKDKDVATWICSTLHTLLIITTWLDLFLFIKRVGSVLGSALIPNI